MSQFTNGHALLISVGADLPVTVDDAKGIAKILRDSERCTYPVDQVALLTETAATHQGVLDALDKLASQTDPTATVVFYFSGHGYEVDGGFGKQYFLLPYGYNKSDLINTAISGQEFIQKLNTIPAQKMLVLLDCCHAGGMDHAKAPNGPQFSKAPLPAESIETVTQGSGRVVIASSRAHELSQTGHPYSQFTMALVEAFAACGVAEKDGYVRAADLAMYASRVVPEHTHDQQQNNFNRAEDFFKKSASADPARNRGWHGWALLNMSQHNLSRASMILEEGLQHVQGAQNRAVLYCDLGRVLFRLNVYDKAREAFEKALRLEEQDEHTHFFFADMLECTDEIKDAYAHYQRMLELNRNSKHRKNIKYKLTRYHDALDRGLVTK